MKIGRLVIALTFVAAFASDSWGQSQEISQQVKTEQKANETPAGKPDSKPQDSKIELAPLTTPSPIAKQRDDKPAAVPSQDTKEIAEGTEYWVFRGYKVKITDGLLVLFTFGLVVIGALQASFLNGTLIATATSADAANLNAEAVISAERAYVFVKIENEYVMGIIRQMAGTQQQPRNFRIQYCFANEGRTPAIIREISYGAIVAENLPREREYIHVLHLPTHLLGAGKSTKSLEYEEFTMTTAIADSILDLKATFWFYGNIVYDDMFRRQKNLDFVFHASGISEGFTLYRYEETDEKRKN